MYKWSVFLLVALACSTEDPVPTVPAQQSIPAQQPIPVQRTDTSSQPIVANESAGTITVAVSYFDNASGKTELEALQKGLAEMLTTDLATSSEITVVERGRLDELLKELSLQKNPYFDQNSVGQLGKGLGATYLVVGSYMVISEQLWIQARVVDVAQGDVAVATRVEGDPNDWSGLYAKMSSTLLEGLVGKLSVVQRKKLGLNNTTSLTAFQSYSRSLDSLDQGNIEESRSEIEQALKEDPNFKAAVAQQNKVEQLSKTFDLNREEESLKVIAGYIAGKDCVSEYELEGGFPADWAQRPAGEKLATRYFIGSGQRHLGSQNYVGPLQIVSAMVRVGMNEEAGALLDDFLSDSFMERSNLRGMASCMG